MTLTILNTFSICCVPVSALHYTDLNHAMFFTGDKHKLAEVEVVSVVVVEVAGEDVVEVVSVEEVLHVVAEDHHGVGVVVLEVEEVDHRTAFCLLTLHMLSVYLKDTLGINLRISCYSTLFRNTSVCIVT